MKIHLLVTLFVTAALSACSSGNSKDATIASLEEKTLELKNLLHNRLNEKTLLDFIDVF